MTMIDPTLLARVASWLGGTVLRPVVRSATHEEGSSPAG
jgi:hypothetical protein